MTLDIPPDLCDVAIVTAPVPRFGTDAPCDSNSSASRTINPRGRPRITDARPWDIQGISRSTYYERLKPAMSAQTFYAAEPLRWFCIKLPYLSDEDVLKVDVAIRGFGFETFYPQIWIPPVAAHRTDSGRAIPARSERLVPLLRSYALVKFNRTDQIWRKLAAFGQILGAPEWPTAVPDSDVANMMKGLAPNGVLYPPKIPERAAGSKRRWVDMATALLTMLEAA